VNEIEFWRRENAYQNYLYYHNQHHQNVNNINTTTITIIIIIIIIIIINNDLSQAFVLYVTLVYSYK